MTERSLTTKPFEPMLASPLKELDYLTFPLYAQPKLDGIRFVVKDGVALTRTLEPIPNKFISEVLSNERFNGFDGELLHGEHDKEVYHRTESVVMSASKDPRGVVAHVFDDFSFPFDPYVARFDSVRRRLRGFLPDGVVRPIPCEEVSCVEELIKLDDKAHRFGYEGVILRDMCGLYKYGRSTVKEGALLKMKRFSDDEMLVTRVEERMHNANEDKRSKTGKAKRGHSKEGMVPTGMLGVLVGTSPKWPGVEIRVGSSNLPKMTMAEANLFFVGKLVTFKHQLSGAKDAPRFPIYKTVRDPRDVSYPPGMDPRVGHIRPLGAIGPY